MPLSDSIPYWHPPDPNPEKPLGRSQCGPNGIIAMADAFPRSLRAVVAVCAANWAEIWVWADTRPLTRQPIDALIEHQGWRVKDFEASE